MEEGRRKREKKLPYTCARAHTHGLKGPIDFRVHQRRSDFHGTEKASMGCWRNYRCRRYRRRSRRLLRRYSFVWFFISYSTSLLLIFSHTSRGIYVLHIFFFCALHLCFLPFFFFSIFDVIFNARALVAAVTTTPLHAREHTYALLFVYLLLYSLLLLTYDISRSRYLVDAVLNELCVHVEKSIIDSLIAPHKYLHLLLIIIPT